MRRPARLPGLHSLCDILFLMYGKMSHAHILQAVGPTGPPPKFTSRQPEVTAAPADPLNRKPCPSPSATDAAGPKKAAPKHSSFDARAVQTACRQHNVAPPVVPLSRKKLRQRVSELRAETLKWCWQFIDLQHRHSAPGWSGIGSCDFQ